jgi:hypothetical protein
VDSNRDFLIGFPSLQDCIPQRISLQDSNPLKIPFLKGLQSSKDSLPYGIAFFKGFPTLQVSNPQRISPSLQDSNPHRVPFLTGL